MSPSGFSQHYEFAQLENAPSGLRGQRTQDILHLGMNSLWISLRFALVIDHAKKKERTALHTFLRLFVNPFRPVAVLAYLYKVTSSLVTTFSNSQIYRPFLIEHSLSSHIFVLRLSII